MTRPSLAVFEVALSGADFRRAGPGGIKTGPLQRNLRIQSLSVRLVRTEAATVWLNSPVVAPVRASRTESNLSKVAERSSPTIVDPVGASPTEIRLPQTRSKNRG